MKKFLFALLFVLVGKVAAIAQPFPLLPNLSLDQWWPFCSATDLLDRTFTGFDLLSSAVTGTTDRFGVPNKAYEFNGVNSELHYSTTLTIPLFGIADFSYSCHIYPTVAQDAIILYNGNPATDGLGLIMCNASGTGPGNNIGILFGGVTTYLPAGATVTLNQWHHLCMRRNGNSYLLFIDGTMISPAHIPTGFPAAGYNTPTGFFQAGLDLSNGTRPFTGKIDDIATYSRQVSNGDVIALRDFNPNIVFSLGPDTAICDNPFTIGAGGFGDARFDSTEYPNKSFYPGYGFKYTWSTLPGDTLKTRNPITFLAPVTTVNTVVLTLSRDYSCPSFDAISITHLVPVLKIGPDTAMCDGETYVLNQSADTSGIIRFLWDDHSTWATRIADTTKDYWLRVDSLVPFFNTITSAWDTTHCIGSDTAHFAVTPEIFVHVVENDTSCNGAPILLASYDDTAYTAPTYLWQDGFTTTPTFSAATTGTYWVRVTDGACVRTDTARIVIANVSVSVLSNDTAICKGASIVANATGTPGVMYQWTPTAGIAISNIPTPTIIPDTSAWYIVSATTIEPISGGLLNCISRDSFFVDVQPNPIVKLGGNRNVCQYDSIRIAPLVTPQWYTHYIYDWTPGTYLDDSAAPVVVFTAGDTTKLVLVVTTPAGCKGSDSAIVYTYNGDFSSMSRDTAICPGDSVVIMPISTEPGTTYTQWIPSTYVNYPLSSTPVTIKPDSRIDYKVISTSMYGCTDTLNYTIRVHPAAVVTLEDSVALFPGESYHILPTTNATYYSWFPPEGISDTGASDPIVTPPVNTRYILTARTQDGCVTRDSISIRLNENSIISVPNAFAPGSFNSTLNVILKGIARLRYFRIYNRWGKMVYEGKNIETGWDGTIEGTPQPSGVYIYEAEAITDKGKILHKQGNVTLLR